MRIVVLNTGTELLLGDVRDAHLSFIAQQLLAFGQRVVEQRTVEDGPAIAATLEEIFPRADLIFVTGGLGPTSDDITRDLVAELLKLKLQRDDTVAGAIEQRLFTRKIQMTESIQRQSLVPAGGEVLPNDFGTAPGIFLRAGISPIVRSPHLFLLPGPPRELRPMFVAYVVPMLRKILPEAGGVARKVYKIANMGESVVESVVGAKLLAVPNLEVGYCARPGEVDLRLLGNTAAVEQGRRIVEAALGDSVFTENDEILEQVLVRLLTERNETLALAESCTGGLLANRVTDVPGASEVFLAGYVTYSNAAKSDVLDVSADVIARVGAVSPEAAEAMAAGARRRSGANYAIATTGIAGPAGGSKEKPVGTVFVALASPAGTKVRKLFFPTDRATFKQMVAQVAFETLRRILVAD